MKHYALICLFLQAGLCFSTNNRAVNPLSSLKSVIKKHTDTIRILERRLQGQESNRKHITTQIKSARKDLQEALRKAAEERVR